MKVHLINPSDTSFGTAVITPRWLYVLAAATPASFGDPQICDETLERLVPEAIQAGDFVGIGIHTGNALRGYELGRIARERGACVIFGGIHATLYPEEALELGGAHSVVKGDGDLAMGRRAERLPQSGRPSRFTKAAASSRTSSRPRAGICCPRTATCGPRCRPCAAARSIARSARCGAPMGSGRGSALPIAVIEEDRGAAAAGLPFHRAGRRQLLSGVADGLELAERQGNQAEAWTNCKPFATIGLS